MKKSIIIFVMLLLMFSLAVATDVRVPRASIRAVGEANSQSDTQLAIVARDMGHGNEGLSKLRVELDGATIHSRNIPTNSKDIFSETITVTRSRKGTNVYKLKVWDLAGNYDEDTVEIAFVNNKPTITINYPSGDEYLSGIIPVNFTISDIDNESVTVNSIQYKCEEDGEWNLVEDLSNNENYSFTNNIVTGVSSTYNWNTQDLIGDECSLRIKVSDSESSESEVSGEFYISNEQPKIILESVDPEEINTGTITINFSTTKESAAQTVLVNGAAATLSDSEDDMIFSYTYAVTDSGIEGNAEINITMTDLYGLNANLTDDSTLLIDQVGPNVTSVSPANGTYTNDNNTNIIVQLEDKGVGVNESTISITLEGTTTQTYDINNVTYSSKKATLDLDNLEDGRYNVTFSVLDKLGNSNTKEWYFIVDTSAPTVNITYPEDAEIMDSVTVPVNVTASDDNTLDEVWVMNGNTRYETILVGGVYQTNLTFSGNGVKNVVAYANDTAGNTGTDSISITIDRDSVAPTINNTQPTTYTNDDTPTITADIFDSGRGINQNTIELKVDSTTYDISDSELSFASNTLTFTPTSSLGEGEIDVVLTVEDNEGNEATKTWTFEIDSVNPQLTISNPANNSETDTDVTVTFAINELNLDYVQARIDTGSWSNITSTNTWEFLSLTQNELHELQLRAYDKAGNVGSDSIFVNSSQDTSSPLLSFVYPSDGQRVRQNIFNVSVNATDNVAIVAVNVDDGSNTTIMSNGGSGDIYTAELNLTDGDYVLTAYANDTSGNEVTTSININVNTNIQYGILTGYLRDSNGPIFNAVIYGYLGNELINSTTSKADGSYSMILEEGSYTVNVTAPSYQSVSTTATVTNTTTTKNIDMVPDEDLAIESLIVTGSTVEKQILTITANLTKRLSTSKTVNATLYVDSTLVESKQTTIGSAGTISFDWEAEEGQKEIKVEVDALTGEANTINNEKTIQITSDALEDVFNLNLFTPPMDLLGNTQYNVAVIAVNNDGDKPLENIQLNLTADSGITLDTASYIIPMLTPGNSSTYTLIITTGTADAGVGENTIRITAYDLVNATDTVRSATGQGFS